MFIRQFTGVFLVALAFFGAGCGKKSGSQPSTSRDAGPPILADAGVQPTPDAGRACAPAGFRCYRDLKAGYQLAYPVSWRVAEYEDAPLTVGFIAPTNPAAPDHEPIPEITVRIRANEKGLDPMAFYGQQGETPFQEASSVSPVSILGRDGYFLDDVAGGITTDLTIIPFARTIVEFELTREEHREEYDAIISSFRLVGGGQ